MNLSLINLLKSTSLLIDVFLMVFLFFFLTFEHPSSSSLLIILTTVTGLLVIEIWTGHTPGEFLTGYLMADASRNPLTSAGKRLVKAIFRWGLGMILLLGALVLTEVFFPRYPFDLQLVFLSLMAFFFGLALLLSPALLFVEKKLHLCTHWPTGQPRASKKLLSLPPVFLICLASLPQPRHHHGSKISSVKANMHTFQTLVETYGVDWGGVYPESVEVLEHEATTNTNAYWKDFANPFSSMSGRGKSFDNESKIIPHSLWYVDAHAHHPPGMVTYQTQPPFTHYHIYGYDKLGSKIEDKGRVLMLSNG